MSWHRFIECLGEIWVLGGIDGALEEMRCLTSHHFRLGEARHLCSAAAAERGRVRTVRSAQTLALGELVRSRPIVR